MVYGKLWLISHNVAKVLGLKKGDEGYSSMPKFWNSNFIIDALWCIACFC